MNKYLCLLICTFFQACATYERCTDKFGQGSQDTVYVRYEKLVPVLVTVPEDSIQGVVYVDSLQHGQIKEINDSLSNLTIQYWMDSYNRLLYLKTLSPARQIRDTVIVRDTVPCPPSGPILVKPVSRWERFYSKYKEVTSWVLPAIMITLLIIRRWKK